MSLSTAPAQALAPAAAHLHAGVLLASGPGCIKMIQQALVMKDAAPWHASRVRSRSEKKKGERKDVGRGGRLI
jgi:hypothetical protein